MTRIFEEENANILWGRDIFSNFQVVSFPFLGGEAHFQLGKFFIGGGAFSVIDRTPA